MQQLTFGMFAATPRADAVRVLRETPASEQPRARLTRVGAEALSLAELLHLVLDCKNDPLLPARLLAEYATLDDLARAPISEWMLIEGLTGLRAARLQAVLELHKRFATSSLSDRVIIKSPADAAAFLSSEMSMLEQEQMRVLLLNTKNQVIGGAPFTLYQGSVHTTVIRVGELFREATRRNATALVLAHNHPSGDPTPSPEDVAVTREIVQAGKLLDIEVMDHLIIGGGKVCFAQGARAGIRLDQHAPEVLEEEFTRLGYRVSEWWNDHFEMRGPRGFCVRPARRA